MTKTNWAPLFDSSCWLSMLGALIMSIFISLGTTILEIAGYLFNFLLDYTIVQFSTKIYALIKDSVETGWTAFRDIANILIIGMFTFIAISIILGEKTFGQKRLIAKVLIIAVLINFSLLFTKMIIDASNFTATQFYNAALGQVASPGGTGPAGKLVDVKGASATVTSIGISGRFMQVIGITGFADSLSSIRDKQKQSGSGLVGIGFGILSLIYLLGAAIVLFYGCFLLVSRAVLLIFLMITASLAFASYLIPAWETSSYGWKTWWDSLLKTAVFAPMLMLFLWITLMIAKQLATKNGTLGGMSDKPGTNIEALFSYLMILGLLFMSFKLSSSFAGKIAGFNMASIASALPFTMANRFIAAPLFRQGAGWLGSKYQSSREGQAKDVKAKASRAEKLAAEARDKGHMFSASRFQNLADKYNSQVATKLKRAGRGEAVAKSKMNILDTETAKAALGAVGVKGFAAGGSTKDTKSYEDQMKVRAEAAEKRAAKIAPSADDNEKARREARQTVRDQRQLALSQLEATRNAEKANAEAVKAFEQLPQKLLAAQQTAESEKNTASANKVRIDEALRAGTINQAQHQGQMATENERINRANQIVQTIQSRIEVIEKPVKNADKKVEDHETETKRLGEEEAKKIVAAMGESGEKIAEKIGQKSGNIFERTLGKVTGANEEVGEKTRKLYKNKIKTKSLRDVMADIQADSPATPPPPATP